MIGIYNLMPTLAHAQCGGNVTVSGKVWIDANHNGLYDMGETPMDGVTIRFWRTDTGSPQYSATTNVSGDYTATVSQSFRYVVSYAEDGILWGFGNNTWGESGYSYNGQRYRPTRAAQTGSDNSQAYPFGGIPYWYRGGYNLLPDPLICNYTVNFGMSCSPDFSVYATAPNCTGTNTGIVTINTYGLVNPDNSGDTGDRYAYTTGATYTGGITDWSSAVVLPNGGNIITNATAGQQYTVRVFAKDGCYIDKSVTVPLSSCVTTATSCSGAVGGQVYWDFNNDGTQDANETVGAMGVTVTAYDVNNTIAATTTTDKNGNFTFSSLTTGGQKYRLEFSDLAAEVFGGPQGTGSKSEVQFITVPDCSVRLGLGDPGSYTQTNPTIATTFFVNGQSNGNGSGNAAIIKMPYFGGSYTNMGSKGTAGAVYGIAFQEETRRLFSSSFLKRHVDFGPDGPSAIYITDVDNNTTALFVKGNDIGIPVPTLSRTFESPHRDQPNHDYEAYLNVGKFGYGDMDISTDGKYLWLVNMSDRKLYRIFINNPYQTPASADVSSWDIPNPGCNSGDYRPFALKYAHGKVYVGVTCSAETSQRYEDLSATVYEFDATAGSFTSVLTFPLNYLKGFCVNGAGDLDRAKAHNNKWHPWVKSPYDGFTPTTPMLSDIEFDAAGNMIIGIMDRMGNQTGHFNYGPNLDTNSPNEDYAAGGDILKAGRCGMSNLWLLENNAAICGGAASAGANGRQGPGNGEFFSGDNASGNTHEEASYGSLAYIPVADHIIMGSMNANIASVNSGGLRWMNNGTGAFVNGYNVYGDSPSNPQFFSKANGLGDVEVLGNVAPLEIGNRVWLDEGSGVAANDNNGRQDPNEPGLSNITITLTCGAQSATTTTDANGVYAFRDGTGNVASWSGGIIPRHSPCTITLSPAVTVGTDTYNFVPDPGGVSDHIDSDGATSGGMVSRAFTTSYSGANNHTYDFGFGAPASCMLTSAGKTAETCNNAGTSSAPADDYITFSLNPTGNNLGATYTVSVNNGGTITPTSGTYGSATAFQLQGGSANNTLYTITVTDVSGTPCTATTTVQQASCSNTCGLISAGKTAEACNNAGTPSAPADDYITFSLNPTGNNLGATYTVSVNNGGTITPTSGTYGSATAFQLQGGSANNTLYTITVTDVSGTPCTATTTVQQASCSNACEISDITFSNQSACNDNGTNNVTTDDWFTADITVTFTNPPASGTLELTGDVQAGGGATSAAVGAIGAGPTYTFTGVRLNADGTSSDVTAMFSDAPTCTYSVNNGPNVPSCSTVPCSMTDVAFTNQGACNDNGTNSVTTDDWFTADITVTFANAPTSGTLDLSGDVLAGGGPVSVAIGLIGTGPTYTFAGVRLKADGTSSDVTATFSAMPTCTFTTMTGPSVLPCSAIPVCGITDISFANQSVCDDNGTNSVTTDDWFTADITVTFTAPPATGELVLTGDVLSGGGSTSETVAIVGTGPTYTFIGVRLRASGMETSVTATFGDEPTCFLTNSNGPEVMPCSVIPCVTPSGNLITVPATCDNMVMPLNNGQIVLMSVINATHYGFSAGATYAGPVFAGATAVGVLPAAIISSIPNAGGTYTVRLFNGSNTCYFDYTIVVPGRPCPTDPMGYIYCEETGQLITGGTISVSGPGVVYISQNGSSGTYQFFTDGTAGLYTMTYMPPAGYALSVITLPIGTLDPTGQPNPYLLGSGSTNSTHLDDYTPGANPYYFAFDFATGDPEVLLNNIPLSGCCVYPVLLVNNGQVCNNGSIDLAGLVGSSGGGALSYYTTQANAEAGSNPLSSSVVSPAGATNYYVRSQKSVTCFTIEEVTVTIRTVNCGTIGINGPH